MGNHLTGCRETSTPSCSGSGANYFCVHTERCFHSILPQVYDIRWWHPQSVLAYDVRNGYMEWEVNGTGGGIARRWWHCGEDFNAPNPGDPSHGWSEFGFSGTIPPS
jgi:hypothetical protein